MSSQSLYYTNYIEDEGKKDYAIYKQCITDGITLEECKMIFEECKTKNILCNNSFDDMKWYGYYDKYDYKITFDFLIFATTEVIFSLKKYVVVKLALCNVTISTTLKSFRNVKKMLLLTNMLKEEQKEDFKKYVLENKHLATGCKDFLSFTTINNADSYYKAIQGIKKVSGNARDIPDYESIILMDTIIKDFLTKCSLEEKISFYPIFIWWLLSTIIPLRPVEILMISRNCIYKNNCKYYIHIDRQKNRGNRSKYNTPIMKEFEIPENLYFFIYDYIEYVNKIEKGPFLIPYSMYVDTHNDKIGRKKLNAVHFSKVLKKFLKEIVEDKYHYEVVELGLKTNDNQIERIKMGDTRHIAFMNMMMQGVNPLYIQRVGGHLTLEEQIHYCSHLDTYASAKIYVLAKQITKKTIFSNQTEVKDWGLIASKKSLLGLEFYSLPKVMNGNGRCTSKHVPNDCVCDECLFCNYFLPEKDISQQYLKEVQQKNAKNIQLKKEVLNYLLKQTLVNEKEIETVSLSLAALVNQKLVIDAYILNGRDTT